MIWLFMSVAVEDGTYSEFENSFDAPSFDRAIRTPECISQLV